MPVLGHALAGWATAISVAPLPVSSRADSVLSHRALIRGWMPLSLALAYLPDIAGQMLSLAGVPDGRTVGHSLLFALTAGVAVAALSVGLGLPAGRLFAFTVGSVVGHDVLDLLATTDRVPLWPFDRRPVGFALELGPVSAIREALLYGIACLAFLAARAVWMTKSASRSTDPVRSRLFLPTETGSMWLWIASLTLVIAAAGITHGLRDARERDLAEARLCLERRDFAGALVAAGRADRWPTTARPGRIAYIRAEAHLGLGESATAEREYLESYRADATYYWSLADLTLCLASSDRPLTERRRLVGPYLRRLRSDFATEPQLPQTLERIERRLR